MGNQCDLSKVMENQCDLLKVGENYGKKVENWGIFLKSTFYGK